jgi:plasmid stability protein
MAAVTIRNLSDELHRALKARARQHGRSTEAEIRAILQEAALPEGRVNIGVALMQIARQNGVTDEDVDALMDNIRSARDPRPHEPMRFD